MRGYVALSIILLTAAGCQPRKAMTPDEIRAYETEIDTWHFQRLEKVKAPNGWLNLAGLFWLEPGVNTFGSDAQNAVVFPKGKIAEQAGYFLVEGSTVTLVASDDASIALDDHVVKRQVIYHPDSADVPTLESGSLRWNVIKRDARLGVRLRDDASEALHTFEGIRRFPVDAAYRVQAVLEKADSSNKISITNVLGQTSQRPSPGVLVFTLQGEKHRLTPILEGDELFIIFSDATNGKETYGGGRFLYARPPDADGRVMVDFNKSYNPPCVFTPYATCPLPPMQNVLPVAIRAGEKNYEVAAKEAALKNR